MRTCGDLGKAGIAPFLDHDLMRQRADDEARCHCCEEDPQPLREYGGLSPRVEYEEQRCYSRRVINVDGEKIIACCLCADEWEGLPRSPFERQPDQSPAYLVVESGDGFGIRPASARGVDLSSAFRHACALAGWR